MMSSRILAAMLFVSLAWSPAAAEVTRIEVKSRADLIDGKPFGAAGPYEKLIGRIYFEVDPTLTPNTIITDIDKAPRNTRGRVEFSADFFLIKPKQMERSNGTLLYEVSNRGGKGMLSFYNRATYSPATRSRNPTSEADMGDGFLMNHGFTLLWVGWQFDPAQRDDLLRVYPPTATDNGKPIVGIVRSEVIVGNPMLDASLADRDHVAYPVANPDDPANTLTVRDTIEGPRRLIPRSEWKFARMVNGALVPDRTRVYLAGAFRHGKIYEVVYKSQDPPVVGVGPAAVRDAISQLKFGGSSDVSIPAGSIQRAIAWGVSQSGRFLRTYVYYGFNEDEQHRKVFDGVMAHVAGAGRGSFNLRFAQPSRDGHPFLNKFYPSDIFPFTDNVQTDPETGEQDGLLRRVKPEFTPKIFYTNSSYEYWGRAASLIHTTIDGRRDAPLADNTRIYVFAGGQHGPATSPRRTLGQQLNNPNDYRWSMRALLLAMHRWIKDDVAPPPSRHPQIEDNTLVRIEALKFPTLPFVQKPIEAHKAYRVFYGLDFASKGIISVDPPETNGSYPILVPQVDSDGNELAGVKMPEVSVPLATYTGWNHFNAVSGPTTLLSSMQGSYIPLPRTRAERERSKDPRASIEERYQTRDRYVALVSTAARELAQQGYLLDDDVAAVVKRADSHWAELFGEIRD
jgi:hypothetical protein